MKYLSEEKVNDLAIASGLIVPGGSAKVTPQLLAFAKQIQYRYETDRNAAKTATHQGVKLGSK